MSRGRFIADNEPALNINPACCQQAPIVLGKEKFAPVIFNHSACHPEARNMFFLSNTIQ